VLTQDLILKSIVAKEFDNFLILSLSKKWLYANNEKSLEFEVKLTKDGMLVLSAPVEGLSDKTKDVDSNVM